MNSTNGTLLLKKLKLLLQHLVSLKLIPAHHADKAFAQFPEFISNEMKYRSAAVKILTAWMTFISKTPRLVYTQNLLVSLK